MSPERQTTITLELRVDGDDLVGRAVGDGAAEEFSGRLGLMHAIDGLLAATAGTQDNDNDAAAANGAGESKDGAR